MAIIAVTASTSRESQPYIESLESRGAATRLVTPKTFTVLDDVMDGVSGLLMCGGYDVAPSLYGEGVDETAGVKSWEDRDHMELSVLRSALSSGLPVLGICRGMQLMNVFFGGSLIQDLPDHVGADEAGGPSVVRHPVFVAPGSKLAAIIGAGAIYHTNSLHHQGLREAQKANSLLASAYHPVDGVIEALESPDHDWVIGVQCHPEREKEVPRGFLNLFDGLIERAEWRGIGHNLE